MCDIIFALWIIHYTWLWSIFDVKHYVLNDLLSVISRFSVKRTDPIRLVHDNIVSVYVRTREIIHFRQMTTVSCYRCYYFLYINLIARWSHELENAFLRSHVVRPVCTRRLGHRYIDQYIQNKTYIVSER